MSLLKTAFIVLALAVVVRDVIKCCDISAYGRFVARFPPDRVCDPCGGRSLTYTHPLTPG